MAASKEKEYEGVTQKALEALKKELQAMGITPPGGNTGTIEYQGVKLGVDFAAEAQKLTVRVLEKPSFVPESLIWQLLDSRVEKCRGQ
ncbi:MAG: hypothetical protein KGM47_18745 [Acidobacteriota bacterium]|nr:hypothetical protein [Acidobacteriota bacterium]